MSPRERFLSAIAGEKVDRLPTQISFTPLAAEQAAAWLGVAVGDLPFALGNHVLDVFVNPIARVEGTTSFDLWGIGWDNTVNDGFQIDVHPLADRSQIAAYRFPDPDDPRFYADIAERIARNRAHHALLADVGFTLWERYYLLRGFEQAMEDLVLDPPLVEDLLDRILEVQSGVARNLVRLGIDVGYTGDDFGSQRGLLFSPATWRRFFRPRYQQLWGVFSSAGVPVCHHSCGDVRPIIGEMLDIGLDLLCPVQTQAMPPDQLADQWGDRLSFWGGISTQSVLPFGTPADVLAHIAHCKATLGRSGRYLIGPSHDMTSDVPRANFFAMLEGMEVQPQSVS
jgi:uroporphyrinogen decarboxylase